MATRILRSFEEKILHVAVRNLLSGEHRRTPNGIIYNPKLINDRFFKPLSTKVYDEFFREGARATVVPVRTQQDVPELLGNLVNDFKISTSEYKRIGDSIAVFRGSEDELNKIIEELSRNSKGYFDSQERGKEGTRFFHC